MSAGPTQDLYGSTLLSPAQVQALVRTAETALALRHGAHFFVWTQGSLQQLLPHQLLLCGAYQRDSGELGFELFNSRPLPAALQTVPPLAPLLTRLQARWLQGGGRPLRVALPLEEGSGEGEAAGQLLRLAGYAELLLHGVSRPQRPSEIESFFVFARLGVGYSEHQQVLLQLLMPHLHSSWRGVQSGRPEEPSGGVPAGAVASAARLSARELEVLQGLRQGLRNQDIGAALAISVPTVKNHVQRILRKLGASNRAHAVALAPKPRDGGGEPR